MFEKKIIIWYNEIKVEQATFRRRIKMNAIKVRSEIRPLKKLLLHRLGNELLNLTPDNLTRLLFDDIPFLPEAQ